jgi:hypothetical protein
MNNKYIKINIYQIPNKILQEKQNVNLKNMKIIEDFKVFYRKFIYLQLHVYKISDYTISVIFIL